MDKKSIFLIVLVVIIISSIVSIAYVSVLNSNKINLDYATFSMPAGFYQQDYTVDEKFNFANLSDGCYSLGLFEYTDKNNIQNIIQSYISSKKNNDQASVEIVNLSTKNGMIYKSNIKDDKKNVHYWFSKNNITYEVYTWDADSHTDSIVKNLLDSYTPKD